MRKHGKNHNELIKELLLTRPKKISLRESNLKELERLKRKNKTSLTRIVHLAILKGLKQFRKENILVHLTLKEFNSFLEILEEKNQKKH
ncbi:hypothetical protein DD764_01420 [Helicobacter pylori]|nr:hypothetical protein DDP46_01185 [Helicobacter pylori]RKV43697.1 hypothetical protein DD764_01420 [Helicobacter pylori]